MSTKTNKELKTFHPFFSLPASATILLGFNAINNLISRVFINMKPSDGKTSPIQDPFIHFEWDSIDPIQVFKSH